jgi:PAS domain S-box-containing protein
MRERSRNKRKAHFLETINAFGSILMRTSSTQEAAWCVAKHAVGELGYIDCIIYLTNDDGELYQCAAHGNKNPSAQDVLNPIKLKMGEGICGHVALTGIGEIIADTSKDPRYIVDHENQYSEITVPILSNGIVIGIIDSEYPEKDYFSDQDLNILNKIASMLSFKLYQAKAIEELSITNKEYAFQNEEKDKRTNELATIKVELEQQNSCLNKAAIVSETDANFNITSVNDKFCECYGYHREELIGQNHRILKSGKQPDVFFTDMMSTISSGKLFKGEVLNKKKGGQCYWMDITIMPFKDLNGKIIKYVAIMFDINSQTKQKEILLKQTDELAIANTELAFQNKEKQKRADELVLANTKLAFQNKEKEKRAEELVLANTELAFQNKEKQKRADELVLANIELAFQNKEKQKRADELAIANKELAFQNAEKQKRADELAIANKELAFQNDEKQKRADELAIANTELAFQNKEKDNRADELILANKEKGKRADELVFANKENQKRANELILANKELDFQVLLTKNRIETESIAKELRQFIETANAPIFGIDNKGRVNEWNQTSANITGFKKDDVLGKNLVETYITENYQKQVKQVLDDALKGQETANFEFPLFAKDGQRVMVLLNSSTRRNAEGEIVGVLGVGQDITILNEYKENLESKVESRTQELQESLEREKELGRLKTSFVSMASHEFRTPLTSINAIADIILRYYEKLSRDDVNKRLEKIKGEVGDMVIMLEDILIIGKSDSQKLDYNPEFLDIIPLIRHIITEYQFGESEKRSIAYDITLPVIMAQVDKKWIKHIIINLFSNAIKYSDKDKQIEISIKKDQAGISFSFKDYGIGISKQDIKLLFKPFHRGENVQNISGTGLGLSVLQKAVELHKGKIEVKSEIGKGSYFRIILPK